MVGRRLLYLSVLAGCGIFYIAYGRWLAWFLLIFALALPWLSLLISLGAMANFRLGAAGEVSLEMGQTMELWLLGSCRLPMPPFSGKLRLRHSFTGQTMVYRGPVTADHCGAWFVTVEKGRVCDYLGLFSLPVRRCAGYTVTVRPVPVPVEAFPDLSRGGSRVWKPKNGGYSENHELRLYRPGDSLNKIHWKLSAKTGKLILRQPMEQPRGKLLVTMHLRGTPEELDRKLGRLLWLGNRLAERELTFELRVLTGNGILTYSVDSRRALEKALDSLLTRTPAAAGDLGEDTAAFWRYHIGGEPDEP